MKILLVEDDQTLAQSTSDYLKAEGFETTWAANFAATQQLSLAEFDLVILDWMLPDKNGIDILKQWRGENIQTPVIMLTAKSDTIDKVLGLELGANDYLTKPYEPRELLARIRVQLRQKPAASHSGEVLQVNSIVIDPVSRTCTYEGQAVALTKMEFDLLVLLASNPNKAFSRHELLDSVWGYDAYPTTRTVDTHVLQLRQKFRGEMFETIRGVGYRFVKLPE